MKTKYSAEVVRVEDLQDKRADIAVRFLMTI
jgi:hypothetical protein